MKQINEFQQTQTGLKHIKEWRLETWWEKGIYVLGWAYTMFVILAIIAGYMSGV
jgi:hypothetical protein